MKANNQSYFVWCASNRYVAELCCAVLYSSILFTFVVYYYKNIIIFVSSTALHFIIFSSSSSFSRSVLPSIAFQFYMPLLISPTIPSMKWLKSLASNFSNENKTQNERKNSRTRRTAGKKAIKFIFPTPHLVDFSK